MEKGLTLFHINARQSVRAGSSRRALFRRLDVGKLDFETKRCGKGLDPFPHLALLLAEEFAPVGYKLIGREDALEHVFHEDNLVAAG